jgi:tetratricopeptide (TPR) repeat protein
MDRPADFFVSYTSADRAWAEWIAWQLEAEGYQVVVQAWDFTPGRDWVHEMQQATATAERVVAVLSAAYLRSGHGEAEWRAFYAQDPSGERGLLLPIRVGDVEPPGLLNTRIYVDLVGRNLQSARAALLAAALGSRGKPTQAPAFPGNQQAEVNATGAPRFPGELPPIWNVPFHPNPFFKGRDLLLTELQTRLTTPGGAVRRVVLTGLGGVGKTSVAVEHVYRQHADYDLIWCINGEQPASLLADLATLANQLGLATDLPQELQVAALRGWLERHQRWLLVLDNVDDPAQVAELLPRSATGQVVITSRTEIGWEPLANVLPVDILAPEDAASLLLARTGETGPAAETAAATLAATLGGLPLALEQAGAYVASTGTINLAGYAELFATRALELLTRGQPLGYQHTVATTWSLALQTLREAQPGAVELLTLLAFVAPDNLPQPLLATHHDELPEPLASIVRDPLATADVVAALRSYSLIRVVADGLFVHRLLQQVIRDRLDPDVAASRAGTAVKLLAEAFPGEAAMNPEVWPRCAQLLPHALAAAGHADRYQAEPAATSKLLDRVGEYLHGRGRYVEAKALLERVVAIREATLGPDHPDTLDIRATLASLLRRQGQLPEAENELRAVLTRRQQVLGDDHPATLVTRSYLAHTIQARGRLKEAEDQYRIVIERQRQLLGDDHRDTLSTRHNIAFMMQSLGRLSAAEAEYRVIFERQRQVLGDDDPDTLITRNNLAGVLQELDRLVEAEVEYQAIFALRQRVLGDDHPLTLTTRHALAFIAQKRGRLEAAEAEYQAIIDRQRELLGEEHPDILGTRHNLARLLQARGRLEEAEAQYRDVLSLQERVLGDDHRRTLSTRHALAYVLHARGQLEEAEKQYRVVIDRQLRLFGEEHPDVLGARHNLAGVLQARGRLEEAEAEYRDVLTRRQQLLGDDHPDTVTTRRALTWLSSNAMTSDRNAATGKE